MLLSLYLITYVIEQKHRCISAVAAAASLPHYYDHQPHTDLLPCLWGTGLQNGPTGWNWRTPLLRGDECSHGASCSASARADEWGGVTDKLGHAYIAFLGNAVKTLEERSWDVPTTGAEWLRLDLLSFFFSRCCRYWNVIHLMCKDMRSFSISCSKKKKVSHVKTNELFSVYAIDVHMECKPAAHTKVTFMWETVLSKNHSC